MKTHVCAIYDNKLNAYMNPFNVPTPGAAIRAFQDAVNDPTTPMNKHPEDYALFELGTWDDATGRYTNHGELIRLADASNLTTPK